MSVPGLVVAGAVLRDGALLVARRRHPPSLTGRWELPGGKVEAGETPEGALRRELREELGVTVEVHAALDAEVRLPTGALLRALWATPRRGSADPVAAADHDAVGWVRADELDRLDWVAADRVWLPELRVRLRVDAATP